MNQLNLTLTTRVVNLDMSICGTVCRHGSSRNTTAVVPACLSATNRSVYWASPTAVLGDLGVFEYLDAMNLGSHNFLKPRVHVDKLEVESMEMTSP